MSNTLDENKRSSLARHNVLATAKRIVVAESHEAVAVVSLDAYGHYYALMVK